MKINLEDLLSKLGTPGRYQILIFLLLALNYFPLVFNHVIMAFYGAAPLHKCYPTDLVGTSVSNSIEDFGKQVFVNNGTGEFESCKTKYFTESNISKIVSCPDDGDSVVVFKKSQKLSTIVTEWDLVCSKKYLSALATTIYFCGVMLGGLVFGHLADHFGRKPIMLVTLYLPVLVGIGTSFAHRYYLFVLLRFVQGVLMQGLQTSTYTLVMEMFLPQHRSYIGAILECFWGFSVMLVALLAYLVQDWRYLQLVISIPSALAIWYICFIPESLRWLILKNRLDNAELIIRRIVRWNKLEMPEQAWTELKKQMETNSKDDKTYYLLDLLRTPSLRTRSLILFYIWFAISIGYYGLTWQLTSLPGNKYLNFFIAGAVEFVAYTLVIYITKRFGRKKPLISYFTLASVFMIGAGVIPFFTSNSDWLYAASALAIAGKFAMGGLFSVIFLYTSELYPTVIRNIGMGACAFWTRVGGVVAPQLIVLGTEGRKSLPLIIFGVVTMVGGFLTIPLPETLGTKLPDNIDDVETVNRNKDDARTADNITDNLTRL